METNTIILLCSDLDRTIIPNGSQKESAQARPLLRHLAGWPDLRLVYVSGRDKTLIREAIETFDLPLPEYAIGDVGTTIYDVKESHGKPELTGWAQWEQEIGLDWNGMRSREVRAVFDDFGELRLQEESKQNIYKLSYYVALSADRDALLRAVHERLNKEELRAGVIWSVDEENNIGLLDILPERANKVNAIHFLMEKKGIPADRVLFAGDSGNDLHPLTSDLQAVLVGNAMEEIREEALRKSKENGREHLLYLAKGDFFGMNGNYSAGVIEGLVHYFPETQERIGKAMVTL